MTDILAGVATAMPAFARQAFALAIEAIPLSDPNPRVGCVLVDGPSSQLLGVGHTQQRGGAHAEVMALRAARGTGFDLRGATAYVTLEPCSHHGRTPPCCDALIEAGIAKVVIAAQDPNPLVAGRGIARLRAAGIAVEFGDAAWAEASRELNIGFFSRMQRGRPWVRLKVAVSLDGRTALDDGRSQWITSPEARADGHAWRRRAGAVLTGIGTIEADDPRLDVRLVPTSVQPRRIVLDSSLRIAPDARILQAPGDALLITAAGRGTEQAAAALRQAHPGLELLSLPADASGRVDLHALLPALAEREVNELHVEAGPRLNAALLEQDLVDELLVYMAPKLVGPGRPLAALGALGDLAAAQQFEFVEAERVGPDLRLRLRPPGRARF